MAARSRFSFTRAIRLLSISLEALIVMSLAAAFALVFWTQPHYETFRSVLDTLSRIAMAAIAAFAVVGVCRLFFGVRQGLFALWRFILYAILLGLIPGRLGTHRPNHSLERTVDRRKDLFSMTSLPKLEAQIALVSGRSAYSR